MGSVIVGASACAALSAATTGQITANMAGFALTYSLQLPAQLCKHTSGPPVACDF